MRIISKKPLREFWTIHPEAKSPLQHWFEVVGNTAFESFGDLRKTFRSADWVEGFVLFNIGGNKTSSLHQFTSTPKRCMSGTYYPRRLQQDEME